MFICGIISKVVHWAFRVFLDDTNKFHTHVNLAILYFPAYLLSSDGLKNPTVP